MDIEYWGGRGKKINKKSFCRIFKLWSFKTENQNSNIINQILEGLSDNFEESLFLNLINLCYYIADNYEE